MANATDTQVQHFSDERLRPFAEAVRNVVAMAADVRATIDDVYNACAQQSPTWSDNRTDGPPHLLSPGDVLSLNTACADLVTWGAGEGQWAVVLKACVRPVGG